jgi:polyhydroxyalkanoate synthase
VVQQRENQRNGSTMTIDESISQLQHVAEGLVTDLREVLDGNVVAAQLDPVGFGGVLRAAVASLAGQPMEVAQAAANYSARGTQAAVAAGLRALGVSVDGPVELAEERRYADPAYTSNAWFYLARQQHALFTEYVHELVRRAHVTGHERQKLEYAANQVIEATAPANFPLTNPAVFKQAFDTGGLSVLRGLRNMVRDQITNRGQPRQVTPGEFRVGRDLAVTPGKVVYRNRLIELIQYEPQTERVHAVPMLFSPPWINKYYIMDLAPEKSLVEWAVQHGHTCFMISYRNPDASLRDVTMSDYLREGPLAAMDAIEEITGAPEVNIVALCLGGTLAAATAAWLAARGEKRIGSLTLLNTLLDFQGVGQLGVFTDEATIDRIEARIQRDGYLPAETMKSTFDLLRATDLVWNYVVNDWMLGKDPKPFDMLTWNSDSTRMPAAMHIEYLRKCYLRNELANGEMQLADERLDLGQVQQDAYLVTAEADHIAPWAAVLRGAGRLGGSVRFVLSNSGHIAGVVNPPSPKSKHWVSESATLDADPDTWRDGAAQQDTSWWEDWTGWIAAHAGDQRRNPPPLGSTAHPALADAPGDYVRG